MAKIYLVVHHDRLDGTQKNLHAFSMQNDALNYIEQWHKKYENELWERCKVHDWDYDYELSRDYEYLELQEIECL